jgi:hypothetical protein
MSRWEDDPNELPAWMDPRTYRDGNNKPAAMRRAGKSLNDVILEAMNKPAVPLVEDKEPKL